MAQAAAGTEKAQTAIATDEDPTRGMPYHDKLTGELKQAIMKRRVLERNIVGPPHHKFLVCRGCVRCFWEWAWGSQCGSMEALANRLVDGAGRDDLQEGGGIPRGHATWECVDGV